MTGKGVFVTGTGTDVGKTMVSAWLAHAWKADYWKPVQTGSDGRDADVIRHVVPRAVIHPSAYLLKEPLSPHQAARCQGVTIRLEVFRLPPSRRPIVVEGAGGVLVPLNDKETMIDLMALLGLPVIVVAASGLGTINHTLLTLEALRRRNLPIAGVIMSGEPNSANREAIEHFGQVKVVAELPKLANLDAIAKLPAPAWMPEGLAVV